MNSKLSVFIKDIIYFMTNCFPLAFSMAVCLGFDATVGIIFSCIAMLLSPKINIKELMPIIISFLILGKYPENAFFSLLICSALLIISTFFYEKLKTFITHPVTSGIMLSGALTATVLFTTDYFGIGAESMDVTEMIKQYISLGFHPNWRGVLYGTIVLVLMITFPRKFKKLSKTVSASFIAIVFTLVLNLFLNPSDMISAIKEVPQSETAMIKEHFVSRFNFDLNCILIGFALFVLYSYSIVSLKETKKFDFFANGLTNVITSGLIGLPLPYGINKDKKSLIPRIISTIIILVLFFLFEDYFYRIPVHSCAVVIIVSSWESIDWREIKKSFNGILPFIFFILTIILCLFKDMSYGIIFSAAVYPSLFSYKKS